MARLHGEITVTGMACHIIEDRIGCQLNTTDDLSFATLSQNIIYSFIVIICLGGLVGNGVVIWLLGFRMKRNPFTTYILNLSIADFGVLISLISTATFMLVTISFDEINVLSVVLLTFWELFFFTYSASQFLLTAISIDRCVAVLFPLWHHCHRPPYVSALVCVLIWAVSFLLSAVHFTLLKIRRFGCFLIVYQFILNVLLCTPLMLISTMTLFIHFCRKTKQRQQRKLITAILMALLIFLTFSLPLNVSYTVHFYSAPQLKLLMVGLACSSLNSSLNPFIYFLIGGRQQKGQPKISMKVALQMVFKGEEDTLGEKNTKRERLL